MSDIIQLAKQLAIDAHASIGQKRKYTQEPYHVHPERVALLLTQVTTNPAIIAAAWLHDVLEDVTPKNPAINAALIEKILGRDVLRLVLEVTDVSKPKDGNRAKRKEMDRLHLSKASKDGKLIKLADLIDNVNDIKKHDPHFARIFKKEALLTLPLLEDVNHSLFKQLKALL